MLVLKKEALVCFVSLATFAAGRTFYSALSPCPLACGISGDETSNWTYYKSETEIQNCNGTTLIELNVYNPLNGPKSPVPFRSCLAAMDLSGVTDSVVASSDNTPAIHGSSKLQRKRQLLSFNSTSGFSNSTSVPVASRGCGNGTAKQIQTDIELFAWNSGSSGHDDAVRSAAQQLSLYIQRDKSCEPTTLLARTGQGVVGVYIGSQIEKRSVATLIFKFINLLKSRTSTADQQAAQLCGNISADIFGIYADATGNLANVQQALRNWNDAKCFNTADSSSVLRNQSLVMIPGTQIPVSPDSQANNDASIGKKDIVPRATCKYTQVVSGDGCYSIAQRCGITQDQLQSYNGGSSFCNGLQPGQYACCSSGSLPDFSPQPNSDGSCKTYTIKSNDLCSTIASSNSMTVQQINDRNANTWGWSGCQYLFIGQAICLSTGSPPMPATISNAICGPQVNGTAKPANMSTLASLNPCPLNGKSVS
jgi:chitinase